MNKKISVLADTGTKAAKTARRKPGRPRNTGEQGSVDARQRLLEMAIKVFSQYGYDAVSTADVARAADCSQPMVHYHFGSKEKLWKAAIDHLMRDLGRRFPRQTNDLKDLDPVARLKVLSRRFITMSAVDPTLSRVILHESMAGTERLTWLVETYVRRGFGEFDELVDAGIAQGLIKDIPVHVVTNTIVSACSFTFSFGSLLEDTYDLDVQDIKRVDEMADGIMEILFHGLVAD